MKPALRRWRNVDRRGLAGVRLPVPRFAAGAVVLVLLAIALGADFTYLHTRGGMIPNDDVFAYECYARGFWRGTAALHDAPLMRYCADHRWLFWTSIPNSFHTMPREYPAPALLWFSLPLLWPGASYPVAYMVLVALVLAGAVGFLVRRRLFLCAVACGAYVLIGGWGTTLERYDLIPGVLVLGALVLVERSRYGAAYVLLGAATLLKLYPGLLVPVLAIFQWRSSGRVPLRELLLFVLVVLAGALPFLALNPGGFLAPLHYNAARPPQIESVAGSLLWLAGNASGHASVRLTYHSVNVEGPWSSFAAGVSTLLLLAGTLFVCWRAARGKETAQQLAIQLLLTVLCTSKLLSPQYFLWLFPLAAYVDGLRLRWLLLAALTLVIYPYAYTLDHSLVRLPRHPLFMASILLRNALLVLVTLRSCIPVTERGAPWRRPAWTARPARPVRAETDPPAG